MVISVDGWAETRRAPSMVLINQLRQSLEETCRTVRLGMWPISRVPESEAWSVANIMGAGKRGLECGLYHGCRKARLGVWPISNVPESEAWSVAYIKGAGKRGLECGLYQGCRKARLGVWPISRDASTEI